jgi:hypothetical protein
MVSRPPWTPTPSWPPGSKCAAKSSERWARETAQRSRRKQVPIHACTVKIHRGAKIHERTFYVGSVPASDVMPLDGVQVVVLEGVPRVKKQ